MATRLRWALRFCVVGALGCLCASAAAAIYRAVALSAGPFVAAAQESLPSPGQTPTGKRPNLSAKKSISIDEKTTVTYEMGIAGDFFADVARHDSPHGPTFTKGPDPIRTFPDQLLVGVVISESPRVCAHVPAPGYVRALQFSAHWEREGKQIPAADVTASSQPYPFRPMRECSVDPTRYKISLSGKGMRLTDVLVIGLTSEAQSEPIMIP